MTFNKILLAFDNRNASKVALQKACDFAMVFDSRITVIFVSSVASDEFRDSKKYLEDFALSKGLSITNIDVIGRFYDEVVRFHKKADYSLIILGTQPMSCWSPFWKKSKVFKVINSTSCPVLSVKTNAESLGLNSILLPFEDSLTTPQKVPYCAEIAKRFGATVHILGTSKREAYEAQNRVQSYVRQAERFFVQRGIKYTVQTDFGLNVPAKILSYSKEVKAGLVLIMADTESTGVFQKRCLEELVDQSEAPIMVVHSKDTRITESSGY